MDRVRECPAAPVAYVALDSQGGAVLAEHMLRTPHAGLPCRVPPSVAPPSADDFLGLAVGADGGLVAWTLERGVDYTLVRTASP